MGNKHEVEEINCEQLIPKPDWLVQAQFFAGNPRDQRSETHSENMYLGKTKAKQE